MWPAGVFFELQQRWLVGKCGAAACAPLWSLWQLYPGHKHLSQHSHHQRDSSWGCGAWGELYGDDEFVGRRSTQGCNSTGQNEITDCTTPQFPKGVRNITIYGGGNCGWASVIYPPTYDGGVWGAQLGWAIPGPSCQNATTLPNYSCAAMATCQDAQFPGLSGYTCACNADYDGDG